MDKRYSFSINKELPAIIKAYCKSSKEKIRIKDFYKSQIEQFLKKPDYPGQTEACDRIVHTVQVDSEVMEKFIDYCYDKRIKFSHVFEHVLMKWAKGKGLL